MVGSCDLAYPVSPMLACYNTPAAQPAGVFLWLMPDFLSLMADFLSLMSDLMMSDFFCFDYTKRTANAGNSRQ